MLKEIKYQAIKWGAALLIAVFLGFVLGILDHSYGRFRFEDNWILSILGLTMIAQAGLKIVGLSIRQTKA